MLTSTLFPNEPQNQQFANKQHNCVIENITAANKPDVAKNKIEDK